MRQHQPRYACDQGGVFECCRARVESQGVSSVFSLPDLQVMTKGKSRRYEARLQRLPYPRAEHRICPGRYDHPSPSRDASFPRGGRTRIFSNFACIAICVRCSQIRDTGHVEGPPICGEHIHFCVHKNVPTDR